MVPGATGRRKGYEGWLGWRKRRWLDGTPTRWTWVWASLGSWWGTARPGELQSMGSQRVVHDWATELNWARSWEALCGRSLHYFKPHQALGRSCEKKIASQAGMWSGSGLAASSLGPAVWRLPGTEERPPGCHQLMAWAGEKNKKKRQKGENRWEGPGRKTEAGGSLGAPGLLFAG